jgi:hypothetical protein
MNSIQKIAARLLIPRGNYCYTRVQGKRVYCPFHSVDKTLPPHENGYCSYLGKSDCDLNDEFPEYTPGHRRQPDGTMKEEMIHKSEILPVSLIWDAVKECRVKC